MRRVQKRLHSHRCCDAKRHAGAESPLPAAMLFTPPP